MWRRTINQFTILAGVGLLLAAGPLPAQAPDATRATALTMLQDWGFQPVSMEGGLAVFELPLRFSKKLLGKRAGEWLDCGRSVGFNVANDAREVTFRVTLTTVDSVPRWGLTGKAVESTEPQPRTCTSTRKLERLLGDSLAARLPAP